ncbi:MAG: hypothetical protein Tsb009_29930 [Planctomycetaceae bacterium]
MSVEQPSLTNNTPANGSSQTGFASLILIALAAGFGAAAILKVDPLLSANDRSRWCTVRALVDHDTYQIDDVINDPGWDTIDKVRHENHFYSSKPPLFPWLVSYVYRGVQWVTDYFDGDDEKATGWTLKTHPAETTRFILLIVNWLPMLFALCVLMKLLNRYATSEFTRLFILAAASLGTLLTPFLVTLNNHIIATISVIFALYPAMRIVIDGERSPYLFLLAGLFAAFTCTNELPAAIFGVTMFSLLFYVAPKQTSLFFVPAALIPLGAFFWTNYEATGGWKPFYAYYGTEKYEYIHDGIPSYWMNPGGIDANQEPPWLYFLHCTIGHHGVFSLSPIFVLTVIGWVLIRKWNRPGLNYFLWMGLGFTVIVLGFYLSRTANYNYGGNTAGLRWLFWLIPFWLIAMIPVLDNWGGRRWFRIVTGVLLACSVFSAMYAINNPWKKPWLFALMERWKWIDYRTASPVPDFERKPTTWFRTLPESASADNPEWIRFEGFDVDGNRLELTLTDRGLRSENGKTIHRIESRWVRNREKPRIVTYDIDENAFNAGARPAHFLIAVNGESRAAALTFLRGLPRPRPYNIGKKTYLFTFLQGDAIPCWQAASRVKHRNRNSDRDNWYRADTWLSDAVPFGVVQFSITVRDGQNNDLLAARHLTAIEVSSLKTTAKKTSE